MQFDLFDFIEYKVLDRNKKIRFASFFSGYDSQWMALLRIKKTLGSDLEFVAISEIDKYANKVHKELWGDVNNLGAVGTFDEIPHDLDIVTWSFPCQDISLAGKQKGMQSDTRSNYGYVFLDTVANTPKEHRPKVLLMENVKALASVTFEDDLKEIHKRLKDMGYESHQAILNAKDYTVAQNRDRIFILSILGGGYYEFPKPIKLKKRLKDYLETDVDEKYYLSYDMLSFFTKNSEDNKNKGNGFRFSPVEKDTDKPSKTITTRNGSRMDDNFISDPVIIDLKSNLNYSAKPNSAIAPTQYAQEHYVLEINGKGYIYINGKLYRIRKLTPRECGRLMDVEEEYIDIILNTVSNSQAYKMFGNSIVVSVLEHIFLQMF